MGMGQGIMTDLGHGGITCVLQTQFSSLVCPIFGVLAVLSAIGLRF